MVPDHSSSQVSMVKYDYDLVMMNQRVLMYYSATHMNHVQLLVLISIHAVQMYDTKHRIEIRLSTQKISHLNVSISM